MKKKLMFFSLLLFVLSAQSQTNTFPATGSAGIGTTTPNASSILEMSSTTQGMLVPRMTQAQRNAIASPATGLMIFQTNGTSGFYFFNGAAWVQVGTGAGANKTLSNLTSPLAIDQNLTPQTTTLFDIGSSTLNWKDVYINGKLFMNSQLFMHNTGIGNTFLGANAGTANAAAVNTFIGADAGASNTTGSSNSFLGNSAGRFNTTGLENSFFGQSAGTLNTTGNDNAFFGFNAGGNNSTANNNTFMGSYAGAANTTGASNVFMGSNAGQLNNASDNTFIGASAGTDNTSGSSNVFVGKLSGFFNTTANNNVFVGASAGFANTTGINNTFIGFSSGQANTTSTNSTFVGNNAGRNATGGTNAFFGSASGFATTAGNNNSFFGTNSGQNNTTGFSNTFMGQSAGSANTTANNNVVIGANAGDANAPLNNNVLVGADVDHSAASLENTIALGFDADISASNTIRLGNASITKIGIGKNCAATNILDFQVTTAKLTTGGVWTNASDRRLKNNFQKMDKVDVLDKIAKLDIQRWHYIKDETGITHIGPMAQDFYAAFKTGDDTTISTIDPSGVALLGIQQLKKENDDLKSEIGNLKSEIEELKKAFSNQVSGISKNPETVNVQQSTASSLPPFRGWRLEQNAPNPFSNTTTINCYLPVNNGNAFINFYSQSGLLIKSIKITGEGKNTITLNANELAAGAYKYSLVVDGNLIDSKMMILQR